MFKIVIKVYKIILYTPEMGILKAKKTKNKGCHDITLHYYDYLCENNHVQNKS
jgi:hypothetical protein